MVLDPALVWTVGPAAAGQPVKNPAKIHSISVFAAIQVLPQLNTKSLYQVTASLRSFHFVSTTQLKKKKRDLKANLKGLFMLQLQPK